MKDLIPASNFRRPSRVFDRTIRTYPDYSMILKMNIPDDTIEPNSLIYRRLTFDISFTYIFPKKVNW